MSTSQKQILGDGNPDGTSLGRTTTKKISFYGVTPVVQAAHIATPTDLATSITAITAILVALENLGVTASA